jgi:DNA-binding transcriptional LysR family regulator
VDDISDVLVHADHPAAAEESVRLEQLQSEPWLYEPGSVAHDFLLHAFQDPAAPLRWGHMVSEYATQIAMVGAGLGVALVPRMGRGPLPTTVRALSVAAPPVRRIHAVWRSSSAARPAVLAARQELLLCGERTPAGQGPM